MQYAYSSAIRSHILPVRLSLYIYGKMTNSGIINKVIQHVTSMELGVFTFFFFFCCCCCCCCFFFFVIKELGPVSRKTR